MNPEILFVTGKGGVGKSTVAAALAQKRADGGQKTLLIEIGDQSFYKEYLGLPAVGFVPCPVEKNFSVALWSGQSCLREYILHLIRVEALYNVFFENAVMKAFVNVAPALPELAIMGKATSGPREHGPKLPFDCLVVDCYATGHFIALMEAARGLAEVVKFGPMGEQSRGIDRALRNPEICQYYIVCLPEELPVRETEELHEFMLRSFGLRPHILMNKSQSEVVPESEYENAAKSTSPEFRAFAKHQRDQQALQAELKNRITRIDPATQFLPMVWDHDSHRIIAALAGRLA